MQVVVGFLLLHDGTGLVGGDQVLAGAELFPAETLTALGDLLQVEVVDGEGDAFDVHAMAPFSG